MTGRMHLVLAFTILASVMAMSQSRGPSRGYYNKEFKVGFRYPANWKLDGQSDAVPDDPAWTYFASISLPENAYRGILSHASATVSVGKLSESECIVFKSPDEDDSNKPVRTKIGKITFYKISSGDVAAGTAESIDTYRTFHDGRCYEVSESIRQQNGRKPDQSVRMASNGLETIVRTFYFGK